MPAQKKSMIDPLSPLHHDAREALARMDSLLKAAVDGIITINEKGVIESFNPAAERIFGYKEKDVAGKNVRLLMPSPHKERHSQYIKNYIKTGKANIIGFGREVVGVRADGTSVPLELAVNEVKTGTKRTFIGILRDITERKRLEKSIVDASEMERQQIGQDLHDTVGQQLAGLSMMTKALEQKIGQMQDDGAWELARDVQMISELTLAALSQVKTISHGLYPVELERHGLGQALEHLAAQQEDIFRRPCAYEGLSCTPPLDKTVAVHLYRIAQEGMSNAIKHSGASQIVISLTHVSNGLLLRVSDNGSGIPKKLKSRSGLGLAIMKYRANMIGSELEITTSRNKGTQISCFLAIN